MRSREKSAFGLRPISTYSIVARDPENGQLGAAVQSHYFGTGSIVTWAMPGVGAVATQSMAEVSYGPLGLELMKAGKTAAEALAGLLAADRGRDRRQVAMITAAGDVATHTGTLCIPEAGHKTGKDYSVQANLMRNDTVWSAMSEAFEGAKGDLAERLTVALEAAEEAGGDIRGKQSAALLVVEGERTGNHWAGRLFDLRVDDHPLPLPELRRLLRIARAYKLGDEAEGYLVEGEEGYKRAVTLFQKAAEMMPDIESNPELLFWQAVALASAGRVESALPIFKRVFALDKSWLDLVPRLVGVEMLPGDEGLLRMISAQG